MAMAIPGLLILLLLFTLVAGGVVLLVHGLRGKARWSSPYCTACEYDLRGLNPDALTTCPECGADLTGKKAVGFVRHGKQPKLIALGVALMLLPVVLFLGIGVFAFVFRTSYIGPNQLQGMSNAQVIQHAGQHADEPWGWNELEDRMKQGRLNQAEAEQALRELIQHIENQRQAGQDTHIPWVNGFVQQAQQAGAVTDPFLIEMAEALYGPSGSFTPVDRVRSHEHEAIIEVRYGTYWGLDDLGLEYDVLRAITETRVNGQPVTLRPIGVHPDEVRAGVDVRGLPPGEHAIEVDLQAGLFAKHDLVGLNTHNTVPIDLWPTPIHAWSVTMTGKLEVLGPNDQPVQPITDAAADPMRQGGIRVSECVVRNGQASAMAYLTLEVADTVTTPIAFRMTLELGGETYDLGAMTMVRDQRSQRYRGMEHQLELRGPLDPSAQAGRLILDPDPTLLYDDSRVTTCWGQRIVLDNVRVRRLD